MNYSRRELLQALIFGSCTGLQCSSSSSHIKSGLKPILPPSLPLLPSSIDLTKNIGEIILDIEQLGNTLPQNSYTQLQNIITDAELQLKYKSPLVTLQGINTLLRKEQHYSIGGEILLLSEGLAARSLDCDTASFVYLAIAEQLKLPLYGVRSPHHFFVRWHLDENYINWETTTGEQTSDDFYKEKCDILEETVAKGVYLQSLTRQEMLSLPFNNVATHLLRNKNFSQAIDYYDLAIQLLPVNGEAINNRATVMNRLERYAEALAGYDQAIKLNPRYVISYYNKAATLERLNQYQEALQLYDTIVEMFPQNQYLEIILEKKELILKLIYTR